MKKTPEKNENVRGVIRISNSKDTQCNDQRIKDKKKQNKTRRVKEATEPRVHISYVEVMTSIVLPSPP
jgi:hypothetical protein